MVGEKVGLERLAGGSCTTKEQNPSIRLLLFSTGECGTVGL